MAVNPAAIRAFLDRRLKNSDKAKRFTDRALKRKIEKLDPPPDFVLEPFWHQKICFLLGLQYGSYFNILDMGLGKSKIQLDLFAYRKKIGMSKRLLVLVPGTANVLGWENEVKKHTPWLTYAGCDETVMREDRIAMLTGDSDIVGITYMGWLSLICKTEGRGKKRGWRIQDALARSYEKLFDEVAADESNEMQNADGLPFKAVRRLMRSCHSIIPMTGTPFNRDPIALWAQFYVVDKGETLGETLGLFRAAFFAASRSHFHRGWEYTFKKSMMDDLYRRMKNRSIRFSEEECLDLPKSVGGYENPILRPVVLPQSTWTYYERLVAELRAAQGDFKLMENTYMRLRMLASGHLPVTDKETGERSEIIFDKNPKLDALEQLLKEIGYDKKVVIFCVYQTTGAIISDRLKKRKLKHTRLYGKTKKKTDAMRQFLDPDSGVQYLVASKSGTRGHNLQEVCHHIIFYETPDDPVNRKQAEKRIRRPGQMHTTFMFDIVVKSGICEKVMKSLQEGGRFFDHIVDGKKSL